MNIYNCQEAFGAADVSGKAMEQAVAEWFDLYYRSAVTGGEDPCQRIAYTVVSKLVRGVFAEYSARSDSPFLQQALSALDAGKEQAVQLALVGGESYLKPWVCGDGFRFTVIPRNQILIFGADAAGMPTDVGTMERSAAGNAYYTLLERRKVDARGYLTIENRLFRSYNADTLGQEVPLGAMYPELQARYTYPQPVGSVGLVRGRLQPGGQRLCRGGGSHPRHR